jgi:hypothetical protein
MGSNGGLAGSKRQRRLRLEEDEARAWGREGGGLGKVEWLTVASIVGAVAEDDDASAVHRQKVMSQSLPSPTRVLAFSFRLAYMATKGITME